jgi:hypothetical protein
MRTSPPAAGCASASQLRACMSAISAAPKTRPAPHKASRQCMRDCVRGWTACVVERTWQTRTAVESDEGVQQRRETRWQQQRRAACTAATVLPRTSRSLWHSLIYASYVRFCRLAHRADVFLASARTRQGKRLGSSIATACTALARTEHTYGQAMTAT